MRRNNRKREKGLTIVEYFLLIVAVLAVLYAIIGPGGVFHSRLNEMMRAAMYSMEEIIDAITNGSLSM